ncbi:MAG: ABC transporter substrate-binding protein [Thermoanaerobaculia bacterium]
MNSNQVRALEILALCALGIIASGCEPKAIPIGAILPITGSDNVYGEPVRKGIELAYEEIQADPQYGKKIVLTVVDSGSDPEQAKERLREQYDAGALLAIGGVTSSEAKAMIAVAERYDKVLLSPTASAPELSGLSRNFYRIFPSDFTAASRMAQFVSQDLEIDEVVIVAAKHHEYAMGIQGAFQTAFEGLDGKVVETIEFPEHTADFSGLLERVMTLAPKAVYLTAYGEAVGQMIRDLRDKGYEGKILTTSAFASPRFILPVGAAAEGVILTQTVFELDSDHAHIQNFVNKFRAKYGEDPDIFAAHGYDVMKIVAEAVQGRPSLASEMPKGLRDIADFPGVTGSIKFNDKGDVLKFPRVYIVGNDQLLYDYSERVRQARKAKRARAEELKRRLEEIQRKAKQIG